MTNITTARYTAQMPMAELIDSNHHLLLLLPRFGMELGVGESTVYDLCIRQGISPELFIIICNIYTYADYMPDTADLKSLDIEQLLSYLSRSHNYYINSRIAPIKEALKSITGHCSPSHSAVLQRFYSEYEQELIHHFSYEERTVFPYIRMLKSLQKMQAGYDINTFKDNHSNIDDKLSDLKNILLKHLHGIGMVAQTTELLFQIYALEEDLSRHTFIEDVILIPVVQHLENKLYECQ